MKKILIILLAIIAAGTALFVASESTVAQGYRLFGPYEGVFEGTIYASKSETAPLILDLTHRNGVVAGTAELEEPLTVDARFCGSGVIPAGSTFITGFTEPGEDRMLEAEAEFEAPGLALAIELTTTVRDDVIDAEARVDVPWFCGTDPQLEAFLVRAEDDG